MDTIKDYWVKKWKYENCKRVGNNSVMRDEYGCGMSDSHERTDCIYWFPLDEYEAIDDEIYPGEIAD